MLRTREFLDACRLHLFLGLTIPEKDSTKGNPMNADRKIRPAKDRESNLPEEQTAIWEDLLNGLDIRD